MGSEDRSRHRIGAVTRLTGLSADVVRVWERRYGAVKPLRTQGGTRLYSDGEIARLRRLRQLVERGHSIGQVAELPDGELEELLSRSAPGEDRPSPFVAVRDRFLEAIARMDVVTADLELSRAATLFPARDLIKKVAFPILEEVGERWAHEDFGVAHEHVASNLLRNLLSSMFRLYPPAEFADTIVMATPLGERHEFGLLLAGLLASTHGWRLVYLGADLPAADIDHAVRLSRARVLALSLVNEEGHEATRSELETLAGLLPEATRVWVGGSQAESYRDLIERTGWTLVEDLDALDDRLRR